MKHFYIFDLDGTLCDSMGYWRDVTSHLTEEQFCDPSFAEPAYDRMREHYRTDVELKPGVMDFIRHASRSGIRMCIASATRRDISEPFLARTGLLEFMEFYIDCDEAGAYKEHPDIYLQAAARLGAEVSDCVVFEDAEYCARTAKNAGFYVVGISDKIAELEGDTRRFCDVFVQNWEIEARNLEARSKSRKLEP